MRIRRNKEGETGQIMILFALVLVVILAFASIAVDLSLLRNNRQTLVNAMDSAALSGGSLLPVDGNVAPKGAAAGSQYTLANARISANITANYPGLTVVFGTKASPCASPLPANTVCVTYQCLIGIDGTVSPPVAYVSRDIPTVCDPHFSLTHAATNADFKGAGPTRFSSCDPSVNDKCNTVVVTGNSTTPFSFGRVVGVNNGSTQAVQSAACNGPCGASPAIPVDVVLIMDRTASMSAQSIADIQSGANTVLAVFSPALQRIALGTIGPSIPGLQACPAGSTSPLKGLGSPANQVYGVGQSPQSNVDFFAYPADLAKWMPVGFSGTDGGSPAVTFNEAYSSIVGGVSVTNTNSTIWKAISCLYSYTFGTNLDTPVSMAQQYLATYGRPGVKKGIILETDGTPQAGNGSAHYTCNAASNSATAAKSVAGGSIEIFTIGFGIGSAKCPNRTGTACPGGTGTNNNETVAWDCKTAGSLLLDMASPNTALAPQHFFDAPDSATLKAAFYSAAVSLARTGSRLVNLYPPPTVTSVTPSSGAVGSSAGGATLTVAGKYFTGTTSVKVGGVAAASYVVVSDISLTLVTPPGTAGQTKDVVVTTPGGASPVSSFDQYTYH